MATGNTSSASTAATDELWYIESSALVAALLEHDVSVLRVLRTRNTSKITSALTFAESYRAILRARLTNRITEAQERVAVRALRTFEKRCAQVVLSETILARSGQKFPIEPIRTLDAIHLATAESFGEPPALTTIVTRDDRVRENAKAMGFSVA